MPRYYVSVIIYNDMMAFSHRPIRARNPFHAEERFLGKMGLRRSKGNYAERVALWRHRKQPAKNLLRRTAPVDKKHKK